MEESDPTLLMSKGEGRTPVRTLPRREAEGRFVGPNGGPNAGADCAEAENGRKQFSRFVEPDVGPDVGSGCAGAGTGLHESE